MGIELSTGPGKSFIQFVYFRNVDLWLMLAGAATVLIGQLLLVQNAGPPYDGIPAFGRNALILGFIVIAVSSYIFSARLRVPEWDPTLPRSFSFNAKGARAVFLGVGVISQGLLTLRLLAGSTSGSDLWLWIVALIGFASPFAPSINRLLVGLRKVRRSIKSVDVIIVGLLLSIFALINMGDLTDWYFSAIGDEYLIWELVKNFADNGITHPFSQLGIYDHHPRLGFVMKSIVMRLIGADYFGWKSSSVFIVALTIPGIYWTGTLLGNRLTGAVAAAMFAFSHYVFALSHAGINPIDSLFPSIYAVAMFVLGLRTKNALILFLAGAVAGLCFYANFSARIIMPLLLLVLLIHMFPRMEFRRGLHLVLGFLWAVWPLFLVNGSAVITSMLSVAVGGQPEAVDGTVLDRMIANINLNLYAFNFNERSSHYISGSLLDPVSATIAVIAAGFTLGRIRNPASRMLVVWCSIAFLATAVASPYWHTAVTRMYPLLLPISLMTGLLVTRIVSPIDINFLTTSGSKAIHPKAIMIIALVVIGAAVLQLNVQRFKTDTPTEFHNSSVAVSLRAFQSEMCTRFPDDQIAFISRDEHTIRRVLDSYAPGSIYINPEEAGQFQGIPKFLNHEQANEYELDDLNRFGCVIFSHPWEQIPTKLLLNLSATNPLGTTFEVADNSNKTKIKVFQPRP